ncbi:phage polarity suppression protein [Serratia quinivorans]|uniref:Phage polarity suppression protein n=1 Tax=Serratia quinivorans TaxID=137545 RepID=A0ABV3UME4_9GAMM
MNSRLFTRRVSQGGCCRSEVCYVAAGSSYFGNQSPLLSVHLANKGDIPYAKDDRDILTTIGFRPNRVSRENYRAKYTPEQSEIFLCRLAAQNRKKRPRKRAENTLSDEYGQSLAEDHRNDKTPLSN